jgi:hypothetical protein
MRHILPGYSRESSQPGPRLFRFVSMHGYFWCLCCIASRGGTTQPLPSPFHASRPHGCVCWHALCTFNEHPRCISIVCSPREQGEGRSRHPFGAMGRPSRAVSERCIIVYGERHSSRIDPKRGLEMYTHISFMHTSEAGF